MKDCIPWEGLHTGVGEQHEEEGETETKYYELTATCIPHPLCHSRGGGRRGRSEAEPAKKREQGECMFSFVFISCYSTLLLTGSKLNSFPQTESVLPMMLIDE